MAPTDDSAVSPRNAAPDRPAPDDGGPQWRVEGSTPRTGSPRFRPPGGGWVWLIILLALAVNFAVATQVRTGHPRVAVPYSYFRSQAEAGNVAEVTSKGDAIQGTFRRTIRYPPGDKGTVTHRFKTERPAFADDQLLQLLLSKRTVVNAKSLEGGRSFLWTLLFGFGPTLLLVGLFVLMMRRAAASSGGGMMGMGRSKAKRYDTSGQRTTFADVAGIDEAEAELIEVVDFLKDPERYRRLGGMIPKGVLLTGPPGTGKTLLARAVAGEANVPFFSMSASEFIEMVVGVGASRARDLFLQAKEAAPSIVFIDELDAIGRARGGPGATLGGHDEREQTLNQILTEMDGFTGNEGVIVLAATNRPEILDPALLRPGRFDRRVAVAPPDQEGRRRILEVHTRSVPLDDVDLGAVAATTPGMVGADLRNLVNEAALLAARRSHEKVTSADFADALEKIVLGAERRIMISADERKRTAFHEAGHALVGMLLPGADPVRKVSIIPRGQALGVTFQSPDADRYGYSSGYLRGRLTGLMAGRAAEELVFDDVTSGAQSDLQQATVLAREMVGRWGMSKAIGLVNVLGADGGAAWGPWATDGPSEKTRELVDVEVRRLTDDAYQEALDLLGSHRSQLLALAAALLQHETLDEAEAYAAAQVPRLERGTPATDAVPAAAG